MKREQLISIFFIASLVFIIYQLFLIFGPFMSAIFWSAILVYAFYPVYIRLKEVLNGNTLLSSILMTALVFLLVIPPLVVIVMNITGQAIEVYQSAVVYIRDGQLETLIERIRAVSFIQSIEAQLLQWEIIKESAESWILNTTRAFGNFTAAQVGTVTKNVFLVCLNIAIMTCFIFVFFQDGRGIYQFVYDIAPMEDRTKKAVFTQINETFGAVIRGQLLTSMVQSMIAGVTFWALGLPVPILFALATFVTTLIPLIGATGIWLPLAIYLFIQQSYVKAVLLTIIGVFIISLIDNFLKPALIGERTRLPYFLLLFGILGGLSAYGIMGVFLAPVVLSVFFALAKIYREEYLT